MKDDAVETMIHRHGLPPRMAKLVERMKAEGFDPTDAPEDCRREVATVLLLVDGPKLVQALLAGFLALVPADPPEPRLEDEEADDEEKAWVPPAFLEDEEHAAALDETAADGAATEEAVEGEGEAEPEQGSPEPQQLDETGNAEPDARAAPVDGSAFDHDGDGKPGGSKPKAQRTPKKS